MKRRTFLYGMAACFSGCVHGVTTANKKKNMHSNFNPVIVLVHGAWHGGWCWTFVEQMLRAEGYRVFSPTLTGLGERAHLMTPVPGLRTHIEDITQVIETNELSDVVLVGHSYAGMVITGVADKLKNRISHIVYLDAALPKDGENMLSQNPTSTAKQTEASKKELEQMAVNGLWLPPFPASVFGIPAENKELIKWVERRLTPHPLPTWTDQIRLVNAGSSGLNRTYILCNNPVLENASFAAHAELIRKGQAGNDWRLRELATGHDAMITRPDLVTAEIIMATKA